MISDFVPELEASIRESKNVVKSNLCSPSIRDWNLSRIYALEYAQALFSRHYKVDEVLTGIDLEHARAQGDDDVRSNKCGCHCPKCGSFWTFTGWGKPWHNPNCPALIR